MRVLIVGNVKRVRMEVRLVLEEFGFQVVEAMNSELAISLCQEENFQLVLIDYDLPGCHGLDCLEQLRMIQAHYKTDVIMLTGDSSPQYRHRALNLGVMGWILKPIDRNGVNRFLGNYVERMHGVAA